MRNLVTAMLLVVGVIHLLPLPGVLGARRLAALYGLTFEEPNLAILMQHRAVLFGLIGAFCCVAAFRPELQAAAFSGGYISVASFLWLAWATGGYNGQLRRVVLADVVALVCLIIGTAAHVIPA